MSGVTAQDRDWYLAILNKTTPVRPGAWSVGHTMRRF